MLYVISQSFKKNEIEFYSINGLFKFFDELR